MPAWVAGCCLLESTSPSWLKSDGRPPVPCSYRFNCGFAQARPLSIGTDAASLCLPRLHQPSACNPWCKCPPYVQPLPSSSLHNHRAAPATRSRCLAQVPPLPTFPSTGAGPVGAGCGMRDQFAQVCPPQKGALQVAVLTALLTATASHITHSCRRAAINHTGCASDLAVRGDCGVPGAGPCFGMRALSLVPTRFVCYQLFSTAPCARSSASSSC